ncbi:MAG: hypothetical protein V2I26_01105 [Halieaceae bacterium]|jgi:hypothetical protein|nr:hypothetical protein [Halieaceae bacterium]
MTEYELLDLVASSADLMGVQFSIFMTVTSAYLVVAYVAGDKLTRGQVLLLSALFLFGAGAEVWGMQRSLINVAELLELKAAHSPLTPYERGITEHGSMWLLVMSTGIVAALYFMWDVRRRAS